MLHHHMPSKDLRGRVLSAKAVDLAPGGSSRLHSHTSALASSPVPVKLVRAGAGPELTELYGKWISTKENEGVWDAPFLHQFT